MKTKKKISVLLSVCMLFFAMYVPAGASEPVKTPGNIAMGVTMGNASITIGGETLEFRGNSITKTVYTEWCKTLKISEQYDKVEFYLQMSSSSTSETDYGYVRIIPTYYDSNNNITKMKQYPYFLYPGEDAVFVSLPFSDFNNFYVIFNSKTYDGQTSDGGSVAITLADLNFIKMTPMPPRATVIETDVTVFDGQLRSSATVEFSQTMNTDEVDATWFGIEGMDNAVVDVTFDDDEKVATLIFSKIMDFENEYTLTLSSEFKNRGDEYDSVEYNLSEESLLIPIQFVEPVDIIIGNGVYTNGNGTQLEEIENGTVNFALSVSNKFDLTEGGREFCLMTQLYVDGVFESMSYESVTLEAGEKEILETSLQVTNAANSRIISFLWDNPYDMFAYTDAYELNNTN